jgi:outer membrane immunogenic protein
MKPGAIFLCLASLALGNEAQAGPPKPMRLALYSDAADYGSIVQRIGFARGTAAAFAIPVSWTRAPAAKARLGGAPAVHNFWLAPSLIAGLKADPDRLRTQVGGGADLAAIAPPAFRAEAKREINSIGTVRARIGFVADEFLVYSTAGFTLGRTRSAAVLDTLGAGAIASAPGATSTNCLGAAPNCFMGSASHTVTGWSAGAGMEYAITDRLNARFEYLYLSVAPTDASGTLGQASNGCCGLTPPASLNTRDESATAHVLRGGLSFRFRGL